MLGGAALLVKAVSQWQVPVPESVKEPPVPGRSARSSRVGLEGQLEQPVGVVGAHLGLGAGAIRATSYRLRPPVPTTKERIPSIGAMRS